MTTKTEHLLVNQKPQSNLRRLLWVSPLAMAIGAVANLGLYAVAGLIAPEVTAWPGAGPGQIVGANIVYLLMGTAVFAIIAKFSPQPAKHYWIVATIGLLLSLWLPVSAGLGYGPTPAASMATVITLSLMHVVTYAICVPLYVHKVLN